VRCFKEAKDYETKFIFKTEIFWDARHGVDLRELEIALGQGQPIQVRMLDSQVQIS